MLFTFPSRYWYTIGLLRVFSLGGWARRIHTGLHVPRATQDAARPTVASCTGLSPSTGRLSRRFHSRLRVPRRGPTTPPRAIRHRRFGLLPGRSPLLGESLLFSLPPGTKMFQFPGLASAMKRMARLQRAGLSHSETRGSKAICAYPRIFAAYHVLHRL